MKIEQRHLELFGLKVVEDPSVPDGEIHVRFPSRLTKRDDELADALDRWAFNLEAAPSSSNEYSRAETLRTAAARLRGGEREAHKFSLTVLCAVLNMSIDENFRKDVELAVEMNRAALRAESQS
jgi:hypothetical protein